MTIPPSAVTGPAIYPTAASYGRRTHTARAREVIVGRAPSSAPTGPVERISIGGAENDSTYSARIQLLRGGLPWIDQTVSVLTDGSATQTELRDLLDTAIKGNVLLRAGLDPDTPTTPGTNQLDLNVIPGVTAVITFPDNPTGDLTTSQVSAGSGFTQYLYGYVYSVGAALAGQPRGLRAESVAPLSEVTGDLLTLTITHGAGASYSIEVFTDHPANGTQAKLVAFSAGADADATDANAVTALTAAYPVASGYVAEATATGTVVLRSMPGTVVTTGAITASGGGGAPAMTAAVTGGGALPTLTLAVDGGNVSATPRYDGLPALVTGPDAGTYIQCADPSGLSTGWTIPTTGAPALNGKVYVESAASGRGQCYTTPTPTRILWTDARFGGVDPAGTATILAL